MIPVIMSGGSGTRLWPVSRKEKPKQFSKILDVSLFDKTFTRLNSIGTPWVITTDSLRELTQQSMEAFSNDGKTIIFEPQGKNTAAAVALLCRVFELNGQENEVVGVFPADHYIQDEVKFLEAVFNAEKIAKLGEIVTLGITPTSPATGYGYIELDKNGSHTETSYKGIAFHEKPDLSKAVTFLSKGNFVWNAGMFIFKIKTMIEAFQKYMPEIWVEMNRLDSQMNNLRSVYESVPNQSIDYGIMEKITNHTCVPCNFGWSDIGSWDSLIELNGDLDGEKIEFNGKGNSIIGLPNKTYAFISVEDLIIVDTVDALIAVKKGESEKVKHVVDSLKKSQSHKVDFFKTANSYEKEELN